MLTTNEPLPSFPGDLSLSGAWFLGWYPLENIFLEGDVDHHKTFTFLPRKPESFWGWRLGLVPRGGHFPGS